MLVNDALFPDAQGDNFNQTKFRGSPTDQDDNGDGVAAADKIQMTMTAADQRHQRKSR